MKCFVAALVLGAVAATAAGAQDAIPDLKGTWTGKGKSIVFGTHAHHPGSQTPNDPPRVRDIEATHTVEGQDGRLAWGRSSSAVADTKEPFARQRQQVDRRRRHGRLFPHHAHLPRPHGEVLRP